MRIRLVGLALGALGSAGACDVNSPPWGDPQYDALHFCTDEAQARCQVSTTCGFDAVGCQTYEYTACITNANQVTIAQTRLYNSNNAHACVDALQGVYAAAAMNSTVGFQQVQTANEACALVYVGTIPAGNNCRMDLDCFPGLFCAAKNPGGNPAVCAAPQPVAQGQSCAAVGSRCEPGTYCGSVGGAWQCIAGAAAGQPCAEGAYCGASEYCVGATCQPRGGPGAACVSASACDGNDAYCDPYSSSCAPGLTFQPGNADCRGVAGIAVVDDASADQGVGPGAGEGGPSE